jgi:hypothetical protein
MKRLMLGVMLAVGLTDAVGQIITSEHKWTIDQLIVGDGGGLGGLATLKPEINKTEPGIDYTLAIENSENLKNIKTVTLRFAVTYPTNWEGRLGGYIFPSVGTSPGGEVWQRLKSPMPTVVDLQNGWTQENGIRMWTIDPQPKKEEFVIKILGDYRLTSLTEQTVCTPKPVPEPGSMGVVASLFCLGIVSWMRRKSRGRSEIAKS